MKRISLIIILLVGLARAAPFVINSAGSKVVGSAIQSAPDGTILLTTLNGQTLTFRKGSYRQAVADKPPELAQIDALLKQKKLKTVAERLRQIKKNYQFLGWDQRASLMLARIYLPLEQFEASVCEYEALFEAKPSLMQNLKERSNYMQALLGSGHVEVVAKMIDKDIASGSREAAARAQVVRGDMKMKNEQVEEALFDYLRTAILFKAQEEVQPEAMYKAAIALKRMNDERAQKWFQNVIDEFPDSEYAELAKEEME